MGPGKPNIYGRLSKCWALLNTIQEFISLNPRNYWKKTLLPSLRRRWEGGSRGPMQGHRIRHLEDKRPQVQIPKVWCRACGSMWFCLVGSYEWIRWDLAFSAYSSHRLPGSPSFISYPVDFSFFTSAANRVSWICFSWTSVHSFPFSCFIFIFIQIFISDGWRSSLN